MQQDSLPLLSRDSSMIQVQKISMIPDFHLSRQVSALLQPTKVCIFQPSLRTRRCVGFELLFALASGFHEDALSITRLFDAIGWFTDEELVETIDVRSIAVRFDVATVLSSSFCSCVLFAIDLAQLVPHITREITFGQHVCELMFGVDVPNLNSRLHCPKTNMAPNREDLTLDETHNHWRAWLDFGYSCGVWCYATGSPVTLDFGICWFGLVRNETLQLLSPKDQGAGIPSMRKPASREISSASVVLCETDVYLLHIQLISTNVRLPKVHESPPDVDFESRRSPAKSESWNNPTLHCCAVFPTQQFCLNSHVWWM